MRICLVVLLALGLRTAAAAASPGSRPHLIMVLQDDLGHHDVGWNRAEYADVSGNITALAKEGVVLEQHYVFYWCSPTRRSFLSGRLPVHHGEMLSGFTTDDLDLRWTMISQKLKRAGYKNYWYGKGHTGYKSMAHLPVGMGFDDHIGYLIGQQGYCSTERWKNDKPFHDPTYSSTLYGNAAVAAVEAHDPATPMFMYLPWQAVHDPYDEVPDRKDDPCTTKQECRVERYRSMLWASDVQMGRLIEALKKKAMWEHTLLVYSADNGGISSLAGNNYPFRGEKRTSFEGGMRAAAFVSGGALPEAVRGTRSGVRMHVVDWYPTFCTLAGVDPSDDPPTPPKEVDESDPPPMPHLIPDSTQWSGRVWTLATDIYGNDSFPGLDGVNVWPALSQPDAHSRDDFHPELILSQEAIISGQYKLITAYSGFTGQAYEGTTYSWKYPNGTVEKPKELSCAMVNDTNCPGADCEWANTVFVPCLFDLEADHRETTDLAQTLPEVRDRLWRRLNRTRLTYFHARSPADKLGTCNSSCASKHWNSYSNGGDAPICGVPGCGDPPSSSSLIV